MSDAGYAQLVAKRQNSNILTQIAETANDVRIAAENVQMREADLKAAQLHLKTLQEEVLVDLMKSAGQESVTTADGLVVQLKELVRGQPSQENQQAAFDWLRQSGNGGIIKSQVVANVAKGDEEGLKKALEALQALNLSPTKKDTVHWQSLGSVVRERLQRGDDVPLQLLGVQVLTIADVRPKN